MASPTRRSAVDALAERGRRRRRARGGVPRARAERSEGREDRRRCRARRLRRTMPPRSTSRGGPRSPRGDCEGAITHVKAAVEKDPRAALRGRARARVRGRERVGRRARRALDKALAASSDNPAALIERARARRAQRQDRRRATRRHDARAQLAKIIGEGGRPLAEQPHGVVARAGRARGARARARDSRSATRRAMAACKAALALQLDDQRFVEGTSVERYRGWRPERAARAADDRLTQWPKSRARAHRRSRRSDHRARQAGRGARRGAKSADITKLPTRSRCAATRSSRPVISMARAPTSTRRLKRGPSSRPA